MDWFNELTAKLPRRNDAEPPGLREQIVAELRDHLECDFRREMITAENEQAAWQRVHNKFGNPAEVALRLWLDAMKGKLLMQKLSVAFSAVLACICFAMIGLMWNMFAVQADMQRESMAQFERLISSMPAAGETQIASQLDKWHDFSLKLIAEEGGEIEQFTVMFSGTNQVVEGNRERIDENVVLKTGETHHFGFLPTDIYTVRIITPWEETLSKRILIGPGRPTELSIRVPATARKSAPIAFRLSLPENVEFSDKDYFLVKLLFYPEVRKYKSAVWVPTQQAIVVTLDLQGKVLDCKYPRSKYANRLFPPRFEDGKLISGNGKYSIVSMCFAKHSKEESGKDLYRFTEAIQCIESGNFQSNKRPFVTLSSGQVILESNSFHLTGTAEAVFDIDVPGQFVQWYQDKNRFSDTCELDEDQTYIPSSGGGFF